MVLVYPYYIDSMRLNGAIDVCICCVRVYVCVYTYVLVMFMYYDSTYRAHQRSHHTYRRCSASHAIHLWKRKYQKKTHTVVVRSTNKWTIIVQKSFTRNKIFLDDRRVACKGCALPRLGRSCSWGCGQDRTILNRLGYHHLQHCICLHH